MDQKYMKTIMLNAIKKRKTDIDEFELQQIPKPDCSKKPQVSSFPDTQSTLPEETITKNQQLNSSRVTPAPFKAFSLMSSPTNIRDIFSDELKKQLDPIKSSLESAENSQETTRNDVSSLKKQVNVIEKQGALILRELAKLNVNLKTTEELPGELIKMKQEIFGDHGIDSIEKLGTLDTQLRQGDKDFASKLTKIVEGMEFSEIFNDAFASTLAYAKSDTLVKKEKGDEKRKEINLKNSFFVDSVIREAWNKSENFGKDIQTLIKNAKRRIENKTKGNSKTTAD